MAFSVLYDMNGQSNPGIPIYSNSLVDPGLGLFIPSTALANYPLSGSFRRFVLPTSPATNGNLVVDLIDTAGYPTEPNFTGANISGGAGGAGQVCIVYTISGGVLT